mgnify:CR=1 FL=1|jgi:hypothetical protein
MSDCKIINTQRETDTSELVRQNLLEWCQNEKGLECTDLEKDEGMGNCLVNIFNEEIVNESLDDINKRILEKKKTYIQLQNMENEVMDYTNERDLNLLEKINKNKIHELIYLIIYLVIGWCFGIYIIFNYLVIEK